MGPAPTDLDPGPHLLPDGPREREVIPPDERRFVADMLQPPFRWVCSLDVQRPGGELSRGSGVLVGPRHVLTAAHNLYRADGSGPGTVHVVPARRGPGRPLGRFKAVAFSVSEHFLRRPAGGSRFDVAMVVLGEDVSTATPRGTREALGHWGHPTLGAGTRLRGLDPDFLTGKPVTVCGYPGDKCGDRPFVEAAGCSADRQATFPMWHHGLVSAPAWMPGMLLHTADTAKGQSGSPVWVRFTDGTRYLVGIHVDAHRVVDAATGREKPIAANVAVHLSPEVVAVVRSWMPGTTTGG